MKKILSLILIMILVFAMVPAMAEESPIGTYVLFFENYLYEVVTLFEDGDGLFIYSGNTGELILPTWTIDGNQITLKYPGDENLTETLTYTGNTLDVTSDDGSISSLERTSGDITGDWFIHYASTDTKDSVYEFVPATGLVVQLTISNDGTAHHIASGGIDTNDYTWIYADGIYILKRADGYTYLAVPYYNALLLYGINSPNLYLLRDPVDPITEASPNKQVTIADFNGTWKIKYVNLFGYLISEKMAGSTLFDFIIQDGTLQAIDENGNTSFDTPLQATFSDGVMEFSGDNYCFKFELLQDGMLKLTTPITDETDETITYFVKATE